MTPIEKLDTILKLLSENESLRPWATQWQIAEAMYPRHDINSFVPSDITKALEHLIDEDYIHVKILNDELQYYTTLPGEVFNERGGYTAQLKKESNRAKIATLERILLTGGATLTGIYGLFEMLRFFLKGNHILWTIQVWTVFFLFGIGILVGLIGLLIVQEVLSRKINK